MNDRLDPKVDKNAVLRMPQRSTLQIPVICGIKALNTSISGIDKLFPEQTSISFSKPITLLYSDMGSGKTGFMRMLHDSITFSNYYKHNGRSWFVEEMLKDHELGPALKKNVSVSKSILRNFLFTHQNDYAFKKYLDSIKPGMGSSFSLKNGLSSEQFKRLYQRLSADTEINRYFYFSFATSETDCELFSVMQEAVSPERYARKVKNEDRFSGAFNRQYDGLTPLRGLQSGIERPFEHEITTVSGLERHSSVQARYLNTSEDSAVHYKSAGQGVLASWMLTKARIQAVFEQQSLLFSEGYKTKKLFLNEQLTDGRIRFGSDVKLVVFLDDPDAFMDPLSVRSLCKDVLDLTEHYQGRLHFFICSHSETVANLFAGRADYINCYNRPAIISDEYLLPDL